MWTHSSTSSKTSCTSDEWSNISHSSDDLLELSPSSLYSCLWSLTNLSKSQQFRHSCEICSKSSTFHFLRYEHRSLFFSHVLLVCRSRQSCWFRFQGMGSSSRFTRGSFLGLSWTPPLLCVTKVCLYLLPATCLLLILWQKTPVSSVEKPPQTTVPNAWEISMLKKQFISVTTAMPVYTRTRNV